MRIVLLFAFSAFSAIAIASSLHKLDAARVTREIQAQGARAVARRLYADEETWTAFVKHVSSGKSKWIDIAVRLRAGTDGGASSELQDALFAALAKNPNYVFRLAAEAFPPKTLCSGRTDPLPSLQVALDEIEHVERSVRRVHDERLRQQRQECLIALKGAKANVREFFKE